MRVLVVDDEPLARKALTNALAQRSDVEAIDTANDAVEALEKLARTAFDVLLLDINMPEVSGMELVNRIREQGRDMPAIVFVTAYQEHAVAAFEKQAADYVLKPFTPDRIQKALDAAFHRTNGERAARLADTLPPLPRVARRIAIKAKGRILFVDPEDIVAVQAEGNYVLLQRESGSYLLRESISTMAEKLRAYGFIRIHRSVLVNAAFVEEIRPFVTGEYGLRVRGGKEYTVTRTYKKNLKSLAELWIAPDSLSE